MKKILYLLQKYGNNEIEKRDIALTRAFILEQFTLFKRHILEKEFYPDGHNVIYLHPMVWFTSYILIIFIILFFLYWILNWGVKNGTTTLNAWGQNFLISFFQTLIWLKIINIYLNYLILNLSIKPQLKSIKLILHQTAINYIQNKDKNLKFDIQILQNLSPTCSIAKRKFCDNLFGAIILRNITDRDILRCRTEGNCK